MKNTLTSIVFIMIALVTQGQTITPTPVKGIDQVITVGSFTYRLFWPDAPEGATYYFHVAWAGNGEQNGDATKNQVMAKWFNTTSAYWETPWNGKIVRNNPAKDTVWMIVLSIPNEGNTMSRYSPAIDATINYFLGQNILDTSHNERFSMSGLSGGPGRMWYWLTNYQTHNSPFRYLFKRTLSMSPVYTTASLQASMYSGYGAHWIWSDPNDPNGLQFDTNGDPIPYSGYTDSSEAVTLYERIHASSVKKLTWDRNIPSSHTGKIWDTAANVKGLQTFDGGTAETNRIRFLVDPNDGFYGTGNQIPVAEAGPDQTVVPSTVTLSGSAVDVDGTIALYEWTKVNGTGGTITSPGSPSTTVTGLSAGTYVFQLKATDNSGAFSTDQMTVTVQANTPPIADARVDNSTITLPTSTVTLNGASSNDPNGTISSYAWSKVGGGAATITNPTSATTTVTGLQEGTYTFQLTVTDNGGATHSDTVDVLVNATVTVVTWKGRKPSN